MPDCSPLELIVSARCWQCYGQTDDIYDRLEILLLCKIKEGVLVPECNPLDLIEEAFCLTCTMPIELRPAIKLALLCSIASGGVVAANGVTCGAGVPVAAPASGCGLYIDTGTGTLYQYYSGAWH